MIAQTNTQTFVELQPVIPLEPWWLGGVFALLATAMFVFAIWLYRRDSVDLRRPAACLLATLRVLTIGCVVLFVLNPGRRSETRLVKDSRLAILVDTSLSMGLEDRVESASPSTAPPGGTTTPQSRIQQVNTWLAGESLVELQKSHHLLVYEFGDLDQPRLIREFPKNDPELGSDPITKSRSQIEGNEIRHAKWLCWLGVTLLAVGGSAAFLGLLGGLGNWKFTAGILILAVGTGTLACGDLASPRLSVPQTLGFQPVADPSPGNREGTPVDAERKDPDLPSSDTGGGAAVDQVQDWSQDITARGTSTRLGSAIEAIVNKEQGGPIAGIVLLTDGQSNRGVPVDRAVAGASNANIPIFTVGIGSPDLPQNVAVLDIQAPRRVLPGDKFQVRALVKGFGLEGRSVRVQLFSIDENETEAAINEGEINIRLLADGQPVPVEFASSSDVEGKRRYEIRVDSFDEDLDARDNSQTTVVEIIEQKTKVMLIAGGPSREFRFLRNQLFRDDSIELHVWLQSAGKGADQESDVLLQAFPGSRDEVYSYDCIVAFDPDWQQLAIGQMELLERWVAQQAGGMIVVAGPVNTPLWTRQPRGNAAIDLIRRLYPVTFYNQGSAVLRLGRFGGTTAFPLEFSRAGRSSEFLWIGDSAGASQETWAKFDGVFGYYAVNEAKDGADILANFADPETAIDNRLPIYLASQFYGAGRVFFQASGEMWRVRRLDVDYFQQYYTKLIRWASQGRLARDSTRGVLLTDRERCWMGDTISVQAIIKDARDEPLNYPELEASLVDPDGLSRTLKLAPAPNAVSPGSFSGTFVAGMEGAYRVQLIVPESPDLEVLTAAVVASIPDLEKEKPQRNDPVLVKIAENTGGAYYESIQSFNCQPDNPLSTAQLIRPQDQEAIIPGTSDRFFKRKLMMWILGMMVGCLSLEWLLRRLQKLA